MTRGEVRRRLALQWWRLLGLALAPLFLANLLFGAAPAWLSVLQMPLFIAALASLFVSLPLFRAYKHALIATGKALNGEAEPAAWIELARVRRLGMLFACLPAWIAALSVLDSPKTLPERIIAMVEAL